MRRDILVAALIALSAALAFLMDSELEHRLHQDLDRAHIPFETLTGG